MAKIQNLLLLTSYFLLVFVTGCASTSDLESLKSNIAMESLSEKKEIAQIKASLAEISKDMSVLKEQGFGAIKESQSSLLTQTSDLSKEIQILKGRFDESKYFMDKSIKDLLSEKELQQARMASLENEIKELKSKTSGLSGEKEAASAPDSPKQAGAPSSETKNHEGTDYSASQKLYDDAQIDFKEKRYAEARQKFEKFTKDFPKHTLTPNSYFWTGESYYAEKKYEDAILSYENFLKKYPSHDKTRGAMLKQAFAFIEIGDKKTGKVILERVIEKYPQSAEAELAEKKIAEVLSKNKATTKNTIKKKRK
ncbi:MAG: tol-pal system protein YbgF [Nitrospirae bacterium]|nr:tol-pal system protein YbgF [Nitrospirota bacterium]